jgi:vWA-MoxR associated protein C-terminal domain/Trypsin-like peptidase domain
MSSMAWRVRIDRVDGAICGGGSLLTDRLVLTCAHVVYRLEKLRVTFPEAAIGPVEASVKWRGPWQRTGDAGDIAVLELDRPAAGVAPCELADPHVLRPRAGRASYQLSAHGFPAGLGGNGDYVTVSSSADRVVANEWLQTDVEQSHLQRIAPGFSGAGLYLPESGQLAGMLTDSVLEQDGRGGYIGRMLPLSTIRRHWPELDDLMTYEWLEPRRCRAALRAALAGATLKPDPAAVIAEALPVSSPADVGTPWEAVRWVGENAVGPDSMRRFLVTIARHLDPAAQARLAGWAREWRRDWAADIGTARPPVTSIVVTLRTPTRNGKTHVEVTARPLVNGDWTGPEERVLARRDQVREKAEKLISAQVARLRPARLMVEFAVGVGDLTLPFDEWHYQEPGASRPLPLRSVPVAVWNAARLNPGSATASFRVMERWRALCGDVPAALEPVDCGLPFGYADFYSWLDADEKVGALVYAAVPRRDWLDAALDIGIPVMVWCRQQCSAADGGEHAGHTALRGQIAAALAGTDPRELPRAVARWRKEAMKPGTGRHYGRQLTLFWDDPARLPDPPLASGS